MQRIIFATTNENKMKEIREILADFPVEILSLKKPVFRRTLMKMAAVLKKMRQLKRRPSKE